MGGCVFIVFGCSRKSFEHLDTNTDAYSSHKEPNKKKTLHYILDFILWFGFDATMTRLLSFSVGAQKKSKAKKIGLEKNGANEQKIQYTGS